MSRNRALILGNEARLALGFLSVSALFGVLPLIGVLDPASSITFSEFFRAVLVIGLLTMAYAYWNNGLITCCVAVFIVMFGQYLAFFMEVRQVPLNDIVYQYRALEVAIGYASIYALTIGGLAFLLGAGGRHLIEHVQMTYIAPNKR